MDYIKLGDTNLNSGGIGMSFYNGFDISEPASILNKYKYIGIHGSKPIDRIFDNRIVKIVLEITGATKDEMIANSQTVINETMKDNVLIFMPHGSSTYSYLDTFGKASNSLTKFEYIRWFQNHCVLEITLECKPFWRSNTITKLVNLAKDSIMNMDDNNDGVANSWTGQTDANVTAARSIDAAQKIDVTGGTAVGISKVYQALSNISVGDVISAAIEHKNTAAVDANHDIFLEFVGAGSSPLTVQPDAADGIDTYDNEADAAINYGTVTSIGISKVLNSNKRSYLQFDLSSIPADAIITSAVLSLWVQAAASTVIGDTLNFKRVTASWDEATLTWNNAPAVSGTKDTDTLATITVDAEDQFEIKNTIQACLDNTNYGFRIDIVEAHEGGYHSSDHATAGLRPKLVVTYIPVEYLLKSRTAIQSAYTRITLENITVPAGTTSVNLTSRVEVTAIAGTGTLWCKKPIIVKSSTVPSWYESRFIPPMTIDLDGIEGTETIDALTRIFIKTIGATDIIKIRLGLKSDKNIGNLEAFEGIIEGEDMTLGAGASSATDTGFRNHQKISEDATITAPEVMCYKSLSMSSYKGKYRVFAKIYDAGSTAADVRVYTASSITAAKETNDYVTRNAASTHEFVDLGNIELPHADIGVMSVSTWILGIEVKRSTGVEAFYLDYIILIPTDEFWGIAQGTFVQDDSLAMDCFDPDNENVFQIVASDVGAASTVKNYVDKITGSTIENPNIAREEVGLVADLGYGDSLAEFTQTKYDNVEADDALVAQTIQVVQDLQPGSVAGKDSYVSDSEPDRNFGSEVLLLADAITPIANPFIQFDLSTLPEVAAEVLLRLYIYNVGGAVSPMTTYAYQVIESWAENTITYNNKPAFDAVAAGSKYTDGEIGTWVEIDITALYNDWKSGAKVNYGLRMRVTTATWTAFASSDYTADVTKRPMLRVRESANYAHQLYEVAISEINTEDLIKLIPKAITYGVGSSIGATFKIWNFTSSAYELIGTNTAASGDSDVAKTITADITANLSNYVSNKKIRLLLRPTYPSTTVFSEIDTDLVQLTVEYYAASQSGLANYIGDIVRLTKGANKLVVMFEQDYKVASITDLAEVYEKHQEQYLQVR